MSSRRRGQKDARVLALDELRGLMADVIHDVNALSDVKMSHRHFGASAIRNTLRGPNPALFMVSASRRPPGR